MVDYNSKVVSSETQEEEESQTTFRFLKKVIKKEKKKMKDKRRRSKQFLDFLSMAEKGSRIDRRWQEKIQKNVSWMISMIAG